MVRENSNINVDPTFDLTKEWGSTFGGDKNQYKKGTSDNPKTGSSKEGYVPFEELEDTAPSPEDELIAREEAGENVFKRETNDTEGEDSDAKEDELAAEARGEGEDSFDLESASPLAPEVIVPKEQPMEIIELFNEGDGKSKRETTKEERDRLLYGKDRARQPRRKGIKK